METDRPAASRERVLAAANREMPDRVPMDFQANPWVLDRLRRDLGASTHRELLDRLGVDILDLRGLVDPTYRGPRRRPGTSAPACGRTSGVGGRRSCRRRPARRTPSLSSSFPLPRFADRRAHRKHPRDVRRRAGIRPLSHHLNIV